MRRFIIVALMCVAGPALASPQNLIPFRDERGQPIDQIAVPSQSPVRFFKWTEDEDRSALFKGRFLLSGRYSYGDGEFNDGPKFDGEAAIFPDHPENLPRFVRRNGARAIVLKNPEDFATAVIAPKTLRKVRRKGGGYAVGHVTIWADSFTAGISCDAPSYDARFVSVYRPPGVKLMPSAPSIGC